MALAGPREFRQPKAESQGPFPTFDEDTKQIIDNLTEALIPWGGRNEFREDALPKFLRSMKLQGRVDWQKFRASLEEIPPELRTSWTGKVLPELIKTEGIKVDGLQRTAQEFNRSLRFFADDYEIRPSYMEDILPALIKGDRLKTADLDHVVKTYNYHLLVPKDCWRDYALHVLPEVAKRKGLKVGELQGYAEDFNAALQVMSDESGSTKRSYAHYILPALIESEPSVNWVDAAENYVLALDLVPEVDRYDYNRLGLPELIKSGGLRTQGDWDSYYAALGQLDESDRYVSTYKIFPALRRADMLKTRDDWVENTKTCNEEIKLIPEEHRPYYALHVMPAFIKSGRFKTPEDREKARASYIDLTTTLGLYSHTVLPLLFEKGRVKNPDELMEFTRCYTEAVSRLLYPDGYCAEFVPAILMGDGLRTQEEWENSTKNFDRLSKLDDKFSIPVAGKNVLEIARAGVLDSQEQWENLFAVLDKLPGQSYFNVECFLEDILVPSAKNRMLRTREHWMDTLKYFQKFQ
ncbi:MAG: hypothetical protein V1744_04885 [Candidatus Altiarchaeota archaeon]